MLLDLWLPALQEAARRDAEKKLKRAALQPARVFGRADFGDERGPMWTWDWYGTDWYAPMYPQWCIAGADYGGDEKCLNVITRATEQYGMRGLTPVRRAAWADVFARLLDWNEEKEVLDLGRMEMVELRDGTVIPAYAVPGGVVSATPVAYTERRFPDSVTWEWVSSLKVLRARKDTQCAAVVVYIPIAHLRGGGSAALSKAA